MQTSDNVDAVLLVIAQTFMDSCTIADHKLGRVSMEVAAHGWHRLCEQCWLKKAAALCSSTRTACRACALLPHTIEHWRVAQCRHLCCEEERVLFRAQVVGCSVFAACIYLGYRAHMLRSRQCMSQNASGESGWPLENTYLPPLFSLPTVEWVTRDELDLWRISDLVCVKL